MKVNFLLSIILFISVTFLKAQTTLYVPSGTSGIGSSTTSYVGIGISNPSYNLQVNDNSTTSNPSIVLRNGLSQLQFAASGCNGCYGVSAGDLIIRPSTVSGTGGNMSNLVFHTNTTLNTGRFIKFVSLSSTLMTLGDNGVVSIGVPTLSPAPSGGFNFGVQGNAVINGSLVLGNPSTFTASNPFPTGYSLYLSGGILAEKVKVASKTGSNWSDFVFDSEYKLRSLYEVEGFIKKNHHLPEIPSQEEVNNNGIDLLEMDAKLLQKIEELTLYMIELKKQNDLLVKTNKQLEERIEKLEQE